MLADVFQCSTIANTSTVVRYYRYCTNAQRYYQCIMTIIGHIKLDEYEDEDIFDIVVRLGIVDALTLAVIAWPFNDLRTSN